MEELGCIEDHCIHWYHQSVWNDFASIESCMEVGSKNTTFTEKFGGIDINVEVPSEVNDEFRSHWLKCCFGSNPRGQVVVASRASYHASVVPW